MGRPTREQFFARLDGRPTEPAAAAAFDEALRRELRATCAILVTDLSGFTRLTKAYGIVHFLSIFRRCVQLATPCLAAHGGRLLKFAADNLIALFDEPAQAIAAARAMLDAADRDNAAHPAERHVRICCGVGWGEMLMLEDDCFGDEVNVAFKLGEDVARPFEILVSAAAAARLRAAGGPALTDRHTEETGGVPLEHFAAPRA